MLRSKSKDRGPEPSGLFMSKQQMGDYLNDLRANRPSRPTGARPPPSSFISKRHSTSNLSTATGISGLPQEEPLIEPVNPSELPPRCASAQSFHRKPSITSIAESNVGRPLARPPSELPQLETCLEGINEDDPLHLPYLERGQRWMERQEAHSLRRALEDMDIKDEEKLHEAAQMEASELVWKHQNPNAPFRNPDAPYDYREHLRRGSSHARKASWQQAAQDIQSHHSKVRSRDSSTSRSASNGSKSSTAPSSRIPSDSSLKVPDSPITPVEETSGADAQNERQSRKRSVQFIEPRPSPEPQVKEKGRGRSISPFKGGTFAKKPEATDEMKVSNVAVAARMASNAVPANFRNPFSRVRNAKASLNRANTAPMPETKPLNRVEIQRNPPSRSRDAGYTTNHPNTGIKADDMTQPPSEEVRMKDGKEIRSDDIRKATSMSLKDRSSKLPTPTMVSDSPGRPIVSFKQGWKPKEIELKEEQSKALPPSAPQPYSKTNTTTSAPAVEASERPLPSISIPDRLRERTSPPPAPLVHTTSAPTVPSIQVGEAPAVPRIAVNGNPSVPTRSVNNSRPIPAIAINNSPSVPSISINNTPSIPTIAVSDVPSISVSAPSTPSISINGPPPTAPTSRPLPTPSRGSAGARPLPRQSATAPASNPSSRGHFTPTFHRGSGALCANCALPISGRIVSAANVRFHPECFRCHHCAEGLECVAFYPEPEASRSGRVSRIRARIAGHFVEDEPGKTEHDDGDETLRFYCHLDFHEFFSPRCKSCKTPIEGEVVVACGAEWHVGHFFCAQCGDPFDHKTPFVEKDGYAWCINCHTNRYSTKCRKCRKPVTDTVVKALGAEWHEECFCCVECKGRFTDGRYFLRLGGNEPFCPSCEERRLKA